MRESLIAMWEAERNTLTLDRTLLDRFQVMAINYYTSMGECPTEWMVPRPSERVYRALHLNPVSIENVISVLRESGSTERSKTRGYIAVRLIYHTMSNITTVTRGTMKPVAHHSVVKAVVKKQIKIEDAVVSAPDTTKSIKIEGLIKPWYGADAVHQHPSYTVKVYVEGDVDHYAPTLKILTAILRSPNDAAVVEYGVFENTQTLGQCVYSLPIVEGYAGARLVHVSRGKLEPIRKGDPPLPINRYMNRNRVVVEPRTTSKLPLRLLSRIVITKKGKK